MKKTSLYAATILLAGFLRPVSGWAAEQVIGTLTEVHGSTSTISPDAREIHYELIQKYHKQEDYRAYEELGSFIKSYPSDPRIAALCESLIAAWQTERDKNPSPSVQVPLDFQNCPRANASAISREKAIEIARKATATKISPVAPVEVIVEGDNYIVSFKTKLPPQTLGADYIAKVWLNRFTGKVGLTLMGS